MIGTHEYSNEGPEEDLVFALLADLGSAAKAAKCLGWSVLRMSRYLNAKCRIEQWRATRAEWKSIKGSPAVRNARQRARYARRKRPGWTPRRRLDWQKVRCLLAAGHMVRTVADTLGVRPEYLSRCLAQPAHRDWWRATKADNQRARATARKRRTRAKARKQALLRAHPDAESRERLDPALQELMDSDAPWDVVVPRRKRERPSAPRGYPVAPHLRARFRQSQVERALLKHRSVKSAAAELGVLPTWLSTYLNRKKRRAWWLALMKRLKAEDAAAEKKPDAEAS